MDRDHTSKGTDQKQENEFDSGDYGSLPDAELVRLCQSERTERTPAFNAIVARYKNYVFRLALSKLGNKEDAEDATQETFIRVWSGITQFRGDSSFKTWIRTITMNVCLSVLLTRKRRGWRLFVPSQDIDLEVLHAAMFTQEQETLFWKRIGEILRKMIPAYRKVFIFKYLKAFSIEQISGRIGATLQATRKKIQRSKQQFIDVFFGRRS